MAKRTSKKKKSSKRRVSGVGASFTPVLGAIGGAVAFKMLSNMLGSKVDPKIINAAGILLGVMFVPKMLKGPLGAGVGLGIATTAGTSLLASTGIISGVQDFYRIPTVNGVRKISGSARQALAGVEMAQASAPDVRQYRPGNYNPATKAAQMSVISGFPSEYCETEYGID